MTTKEAYEKYRHMDKLLSDTSLNGDDYTGHIMRELWAAIKTSCEAKPERALLDTVPPTAETDIGTVHADNV